MNSHFLRMVLIAASALSTMPAAASTEKLLYSFPANSSPRGHLVQDGSGALFGATFATGGYGAIYRLKQENGGWREDVLFEFSNTDGANPGEAFLIDHDTAILYGTTDSGGDSGGYGTVYSLAPTGQGWTETVLHSFSNSRDGAYPLALLKDKQTGNLYGVTEIGGRGDCGTAFQLTPSGGGWIFSTIYTFPHHNRTDACYPITTLRAGATPGTLIGGAFGGSKHGTIFQLKLANGVWSESVIHSFLGGEDGGFPIDLDASADGTIYGVTLDGGHHHRGVVFKLTPNEGAYSYSVIYRFRGGSDGSEPVGINFDAATGNIYGNSRQGGNANLGTVFKLTPNGEVWAETVLHSFAGGASDGEDPDSRPTVDRTTGALYGATGLGGANNGGVVYMVQP